MPPPCPPALLALPAFSRKPPAAPSRGSAPVRRAAPPETPAQPFHSFLERTRWRRDSRGPPHWRSPASVRRGIAAQLSPGRRLGAQPDRAASPRLALEEFSCFVQQQERKRPNRQTQEPGYLAAASADATAASRTPPATSFYVTSPAGLC